METLTHTDRARAALLQNLARALAYDAADVLAPHAGLPIDANLREKLAADVYDALRNNMPPLENVQHALDEIRP